MEIGPVPLGSPPPQRVTLSPLGLETGASEVKYGRFLRGNKNGQEKEKTKKPPTAAPNQNRPVSEAEAAAVIFFAARISAIRNFYGGYKWESKDR